MDNGLKSHGDHRNLMLARLPAPFGHVVVEADDGRVRALSLEPEPAPEEIPDGFPEHVLVAVRAYLDGRAPRPIAPTEEHGTEFQQVVWHELTNIQPGRTLTYGELAERVGKPGAARAVGQALRRNPLPLIWPCHRVVAKDGLGGFGGCTEADPDGEGPIRVKSWLLNHEEAMVSRRKAP